MAKEKVGKKQPSKLQVVKVTDTASPVKTTKTGIALIPGVSTDHFTTLIIGTAPLICHKFSEKMREKILAKHKGEASAGRERKDPEANFQAARYRLLDKTDGIPAGGLKAAFVKGFSKESGVPMTKAKGAIRIAADCAATNLVRIITPHEPQMREDVVRNESGVVDIRHRPEYWPWALHLQVEFLPTVASMKQVLQAIAVAGFVEGLCEWRPGSKSSLSGTYGTWRIATAEEAELFERDKLFSAVKQAAE